MIVVYLDNDSRRAEELLGPQARRPRLTHEDGRLVEPAGEVGGRPPAPGRDDRAVLHRVRDEPLESHALHLAHHRPELDLRIGAMPDPQCARTCHEAVDESVVQP
jgi:hypothetical protein